jgi:hypothetical protein
MTLEDSIEPSYLLTGAPSISKSYSLSLDAEIILGRDGVNLKA